MAACTACCPSNLARLVPQVAGYLYAQRGAQVFTVLYAASETTLDVGGNQVHLTQQTDYPFDGRVALQLAPERETKFALSLRIPTWAGERPVPGALYHFLDAAPQWSLRVNGEVVEATVENGYVTLDRTWQGGDRVELTLPMAVRAVTGAGGAIVVEPFAFPGGRRFHFTDPAGNELAVWSER